ncbi:MAG: FtsX-like permease family protein [Luteitalea sp.]|nr:FtsX-like permease family protein [Luteitalea sp.]
MLEEDKLRRGMTAEQARRAARLELGSVTQLREAHRETRGLPLVETVLQDLRYTFRTFRRDAGITAFAILIVGLGVGASTTVFSVVNAVLLRPLPFHHSERLAWISNIADDGVSEWKVQVNHLLDLREQNQSFSDLTAYFGFVERGDQVLTGDGEPERLATVSVSENFFAFLGVQPILGRLFTPQECLFDGPLAVLLSYQLWQRRFSADPDVVGQTITLDEASVAIVGVLPESFDFGTVFAPGTRVDLFSPYPLSEETNRYGNVLAVIGRLQPGATLESARAELTALGERLTRDHPERNTIKPKLTPLDQRVSGRFRPALLVLAWAVGAVMLIVCANLSNLQLSRMAKRQKEMAVRVALGAGRGRLVRQMLTESILLSCCGAAAGLLVAVAGTQAISGLDAFNIPRLESVQIDVAALGLTALIAVLTGLVFGLMPALQVPAVAVHNELNDNSRSSSHSKKHAWTCSALVISEVALACVLLVGSGLLIRSFLRALDVDLGFQPEKLAALRINPDSDSAPAKRNAYFNEVLRRTQSIPGVRDAALANLLPLGGNLSRGVAGKGQTYARDAYPQGFVRIVSEGYFGTMGVPLRAGRDFTNRDSPTSEPVVILNEMLANMLWPGEDPIGKEITEFPGRRVVGIVGNVRHRSLEEGYTGEMYIPIRQTNDYRAVDLVVRTDLHPAALASSVRAALAPIAPTLPASEWRTLQQLVDKAISPRRFVVLLLAGFAGFALILASLGIYAVISYSVGQRRQEIGIRMALGASATDMQNGILLQTLKLAATGMALGLVASWGFGQAIQGLLFNVTPSDPATFATAFAVLMTVAALAGYLPARRASRVDPAIALRAE